jgi:hypothetical protein
MSGRIPTLLFALCLCSSLVAGCVAEPVFVMAPPATVAAPQTPAAVAVVEPTGTTVPTQPAATVAPVQPTATTTSVGPTATSAPVQPSETAAPSKPVATVAPGATVTTTAGIAKTHVINIPGQPFTFSVPLNWREQDPGTAGSDVVVVADWTSPDDWSSPPPEGVKVHLVAVATQPFPDDATETEISKAAEPDALSNQVQAMIQDSCGDTGVIDDPQPIQIDGHDGTWVHCKLTVNGREMHLSTAYTVRGNLRLAMMGLAVDPAAWSELASTYEEIIKSVHFTQ